MSAGVPAFAADTVIPKVKDASATTENTAVQSRSSTYEFTRDYVRVHSSPSLFGSVKGSLMKGEIVSVGHYETEGPVYADGHIWLRATIVGSGDWIDTDYLNKIG